MQYTVLYDNPEETLFERLMKIRNVSDDHETFLNPTYKSYRQEPMQLNEMDVACKRISQAISANEKIMIFGDYDVDGIMASYIMYTFFRKYLGYHAVSIRLPHRTKDGYGIKKHHIEKIHQEWCSLIITVDNGITSVTEAEYAKELGIDLIITDHHQPLEIVPSCIALVNPQCSPAMRFKEICWATVALKVCCALADTINLDRTTKKQMLKEFLPYASMATVADCMPLVDENRLIVKKGLSTMNTDRAWLPTAIRTMLDYFNIKTIDTYHIGFQIGPRLNATGRISDAMEWLKSFLLTDEEKIIQQFEHMDVLNNERKQIQDTMAKRAKELIDPEQMLLFAADESFHEWIVGIVAWRIAEKYNKPAILLRIDEKKWHAVGSLRGPDYFNIIEMLTHAEHLLERYWGHEQAWWATITLDNLTEFEVCITKYCNEVIPKQALTKVITVDTKLYAHDITSSVAEQMSKLWPFGIGNPEPLIALENIRVNRVETIGSSEKTHLKLFGSMGATQITAIQWWKWDLADTIETGKTVTLIGKIKPDTYNWGIFIDTKTIL